jgi:hypothetical protein
MLDLAFRNIFTFGYESTTEYGLPSWFATIQEKHNSVPLSLTFYLAQGYPLRFLAPTHVYELPTGFSKKVPPKSPTDALLYMLLVLQLRPPFGVFSPQHQPFISPNSNKNTEPAMI